MSFLKSALIALAVTAISSVELSGQTNRVQLNQFNNSWRMLAMLGQSQVVEDLELESSQCEQLTDLLNEARKKYGAIMEKRMEDKSFDNKSAWLLTYTSEISPALQEILLPFQIERVEQICFQETVGASGLVCGVLHPYVFEKLDIGPEQKEAIEKIEQVAVEEIRKLEQGSTSRQKEILAESLKAFIDCLDDEQKQKMESQMKELIPKSTKKRLKVK